MAVPGGLSFIRRRKTMIKNRRDFKVHIACLLLFSIGFEVGALQSLIREFSASFSLDALGMGFLVSVQYLGLIVSAAFFGYLADRFGKKWILLVSILLFAGSILLISITHQFSTLVVGLFFVGVGYGGSESICTAMLGDDKANASRLINLSQACFCIGALVSPLLIPSLHLGWSQVFLFDGILAILAAFMLLFHHVPDVENNGVLPSAKTTYPLREKSFLLLLACMVMYVGLENGFGYFSESYFYESFNATTGSYAISLYWGSMAISRLLHSVAKVQNLYRQLTHRFIVTALLFAALIVCKSIPMFFVIASLMGFVHAPIWAAIMTLATRLHEDQSASAVGLLSSACGVSGVLFPSLLGYVSSGHTIRIGYSMLAGCSVLAGFLVFVAYRASGTSVGKNSTKNGDVCAEAIVH